MIPFKDDVPTRRRPVITITLIVVNCLVFIFQLLLPPESHHTLLQAFGVVPARMTKISHYFVGELNNPLVSVFTAMFLHGGWLHLLGNMLYLWIFGNNVEDSMGRLRFIAFYLICGLAATAAQITAAPAAKVPMIGASGAISDVPDPAAKSCQKLDPPGSNAYHFLALFTSPLLLNITCFIR